VVSTPDPSPGALMRRPVFTKRPRPTRPSRAADVA
jgi:hypothetical protein